MARYGDDPVVMAWELWNEINACRTSDFAIQREWTRAMLKEVKRRSPRNLAVNSLGSFDHETVLAVYEDFHMDEMDFQQVHRYLDQGAGLEICCTDPVALSIDAVRRARRPDRPILLAETGAVNDNHTGPFRHYRVDHPGMLLHDVTYPAFFAGAAGSGHSWFWEHYVEPKQLWWHLSPMAALIDGVALDREDFEPEDLSTPNAWVLALVGKRHVLLWVRNKAHRWDHVLRDGKQPPPIIDMPVDLALHGIREGRVRFVRTWREDAVRGHDEELDNGILVLPAFRYGLAARIAR
jgi:hypothetical protein